jgi:hypothetical protein
MPSPRVRQRYGLLTGFVFSQTCLQAYADCPRSFQLRYIDRVIWPAAQAEPAIGIEMRQREGQIFHGLVQQHLLGLPAESLTPLANRPSVARWWQNYLAADLRLGGYTHHTEFRLSSPIGHYRLLAKYDLLGLKDGAAIIFDWKTASRRPNDEWLAARWQTVVYRALLVHAGTQLNANQPVLPECVTMVYWFADFPSEPSSFVYDEGTYRRDWSAVELLVDTISSDSEFLPANDAGRCPFCGYRSYCAQSEDPGRHAETDLQNDPAFDSTFD